MQRIGLILLAMASLVASGVIMDRSRVGLNTMNDLGLQTIYGKRGGLGRGNVLTQDELLRQKFILDIVHQIYAPLQQRDLLELSDRSTVCNENVYMRPFTQDMQMVLDLICSKQMLGKQEIFSLNNEYHIRQAVGLYRLMVTARDYDTFKHLAVYARQNINTEMFVHCLVLALGERQDTQMLIVPALYEILPQLYVKDQVIDQVRHLDTGVSSIKPQLIDIVGLGRRNSLFNPRFIDQQPQGGLMDVLTKSQFWMPWRELHKQIAYRKMVGRNVVEQDDTQMDKLVISLPGNGLLSQDIGFKSYVTLLINQLLVDQETIDERRFGNVRGENDYLRGERRYLNREEERDYHYTNMGRRNMQEGQRGVNTVSLNDARLLFSGRRRNNPNNVLNMDNNRYDEEDLISGGRRVYKDSIKDERQRSKQYYGDDDFEKMNNYRYMMNTNADQKRGINSYDYMQKQYLGRSGDDFLNFVSRGAMGRRQSFDNDVYNRRLTGQYNGESLDMHLPTTNINDERLLYINRRKLNNVVEGRRANNIEGEFDDAHDRYYTGYQRGTERSYFDERDIDNENYRNEYKERRNIDDARDNYYTQGYNTDYQRTYFDEQNKRNTIRRDYQDKYLGERNIDNGKYGDYIPDRRNIYDINDRYNTEYQKDYTNIVEGRRVDNVQGDYDIRNRYNADYPRSTKRSYFDERDIDTENYRGKEYERSFMDDTRDRYNTDYQRGNTNTQKSYLDKYLGERDMDIETQGHRYRRSIVNQGYDQTSTINGKLILHTLQQLVARLNIERIALGQPQLMDYTQNNYGRGIFANANNMMAQRTINGVDVQSINKIENIIERIENALDQRIGEISVLSYNQKVNEIGLMLAGQIRGLGLVDILGNVLEETYTHQRKGLITNLMENEAAQVLLAGIVKVVDQKLQQVYHQREDFISTVTGVTINNVKVDKLITYVEQAEIDLSNLLNKNYNDIDETMQKTNKVVVGRVPRLNHKSFAIDIDVTSDRQQQVVVRNLLVPKVDGQDNIIPLMERRQNVIVLDITKVELEQGRNTLKLKSNHITITSRDTTPLTKIYQLVMQALNGQITLQQDQLAGQTTLLPHRLLLPRGRPDGLPMQLITVITPVEHYTDATYAQERTGLNTLLRDNLPLNYPLHCDITDLDKVISMPNLMAKDVNIYHEDNSEMPLTYRY